MYDSDRDDDLAILLSSCRALWLCTAKEVPELLSDNEV